jgi:hypothetical protein
VVLKDYARAVAIYIQEHAKGKYVRMVPAELRNLHELYVVRHRDSWKSEERSDNADSEIIPFSSNMTCMTVLEN